MMIYQLISVGTQQSPFVQKLFASSSKAPPLNKNHRGVYLTCYAGQYGSRLEM